MNEVYLQLRNLNNVRTGPLANISAMWNIGLHGPDSGGGYHRARGGQLRRVPRVRGGGELGGGGGLHQVIIIIIMIMIIV